MTVYDRWHKTHPDPKEEKCKEHRLVPTEEHDIGGRWQVRYRDEDGKQKKKNFKKKTGKNPEIHADAYDAQVNAQLSQGTWIDPAKEKTLLNVVIDEWKAALRGEIKTVNGKVSKTDSSIVPNLGCLSLKTLCSNSHHIQKWIDHLEQDKHYAPNTVIAYKKVLINILNFAVTRKYITINPLSTKGFVELIPPPKKRIVPYTAEEAKRLHEELPENLKAILLLGLKLGLRIGEIFALSPDDVMDHGVLMVSTQMKMVERKLVFALPKRKKVRVVPLTDSTRELITSLPLKALTLPWNDPKGKPKTINVCINRWEGEGSFNPDSIRRQWYHACDRAGIAKSRRGFHLSRHTYASKLLNGNVDIRALSEYLGHSDPGFTLKTYCHLMPSAADAARRALDDSL